jgi:hypothetical protein
MDNEGIATAVTEHIEAQPAKKRGAPKVLKCAKGHALLGDDGKALRESFVGTPPECVRCARGEDAPPARSHAKKAESAAKPSRAPIPGIDTETPEQKAEKERAAEAAKDAAAQAAEMQRAKTAGEMRQVADLLRSLITNDIAATASVLVERRGKIPARLIPAKVVRQGIKPGQPLEVTPSNAEEALSIGLADGVVYLAPSIPFLSHPALPAALTVTFALLAIMRAPMAEPARPPENTRVEVKVETPPPVPADHGEGGI